MRGVRSGDKGRGKDGEPLGNFEPGSDVTAQATVLAEGCWGHLTGAAIRGFDLAADREPQVWALGVKEVWEVAKPLDRVIHTLGWPLRYGAKYKEFGGSWIYPMKRGRATASRSASSSASTTPTRRLSAHDLLQQFKTAPARAQDPRGRQARRLGREGDPRGRLLGDAQAARARAWCIAGDAGRHGQRARSSRASTTRSTSGMLAAETIYAAAQGRLDRLLGLRAGGRGLARSARSSTSRAT